MSSPTQRSLALLRNSGFTAQVVERWNAYARVRVDLFGCIDIVALIPGSILGVQATSRTNVNQRMAKSIATPALKKWLLAGGKFEVWGWSKKGPRGRRKTWQVYRCAIILTSKGKLNRVEL